LWLKLDLKHLFRLILTVLTLSTGVIVLLSFVLDSPVIDLFRGVFVEWTVIVVAFAMILGVFNVLQTHARRIQSGQGAIYSVILVVAFLAVFIPGILPADRVPESYREFVGPTGSIVDLIYRYVQRPLQSTLFSLIALFAITAAWRAFRVRNMSSFVMFIASVLVLLGSVDLDVGGWELFTETKRWIMSVPAMAGARGLLLGIALATIVAGARLLVGIDRPYSD
jgi:hypothetical protein